MGGVVGQVLNAVLNPMASMGLFGEELYKQGQGQTGLEGYINRTTGRTFNWTKGEKGNEENLLGHSLGGFGPATSEFFQTEANRKTTQEQEYYSNNLTNAANYASAKSKYENDLKKVADELAKKKAADDKAAAEAATLLATRRRATNPYATSERGILGGAPLNRKTLLGQ